jgi:hypothetical protein
MMKIADLEREIEVLNPKQQKRLMGFLLSLQIRRDHDYRRELTARVDERDPAKWTSFEDLGKQGIE